MSLSSSGDLLQFGDSTGSVVCKYFHDAGQVNMYSRPLEYRDPPEAPPAVHISDTDPLSLVGMPYYTEPLLSAWPNTMVFNVGRPSPKIPPEILANMRMIDFVGYAPNPKSFKRNQILALSYKQSQKTGPKFRSQKVRDRALGIQDDDSEDVQRPGEEDFHSLIPKKFLKVDIKYSKFGVEDFDFSFYNKTQVGGLENHIRNEYCNSLLQVLFYTLPLRHVCKAHLSTDCPNPRCLMCELGFLFRMLEDAKGLNCQASNFLKVFSSIPQGIFISLF